MNHCQSQEMEMAGYAVFGLMHSSFEQHLLITGSFRKSPSFELTYPCNEWMSAYSGADINSWDGERAFGDASEAPMGACRTLFVVMLH